MDKSYIIRIYSHEKKIVRGIVEDVELSERSEFNNIQKLWSIITKSELLERDVLAKPVKSNITKITQAAVNK